MLTPRGLFINVPRAQTRRLARCWKLTAENGSVVRVNSSSVDLTFGGEVYTPGGSADASVARKQGGLRDHDLEFRGAISSSGLTDSDLMAGKWDRAAVVESLVDWDVPELGALWRTLYWIAEVTHDGSAFTAATVGLTRHLAGARGDVHGLHCRHELGVIRPDGDGCPVNLASVTVTGVVPTAFGDGARKVQIRAGAVSGSFADGWFAQGKFKVTSGANLGVVRNVKRYTQATREFELQTPLPHPMTTSDTFSVSYGCDKLFATCRDKFGVSISGFGGAPTMPGNDGILIVRPAA